MREGFLERNARSKHIMRFVIDCVDVGALRKVLSLVEVELSSGKKILRNFNQKKFQYASGFGQWLRVTANLAS